jgi:hypothetical protein
MRKLLISGVLLLALGGCGGGDDKADPGVATLRSESPAAGRPSPSPAQQRPVLRPDMSDAEVIALENAWTRCLGDHGVPLQPAVPDAVVKPTVDLTLPQYKAATQACAVKEPEDWRDVEARTDPQYADRLRVEVQCLKDKGIKAELRGQPPHIVFVDDRQVARALDLTPECEKKAFGDVMKQFNEK